MNQYVIADLDLSCANCGQDFVFSAGEQELQQLRGISRTPENCPACTRRAMWGPVGPASTASRNA